MFYRKMYNVIEPKWLHFAILSIEINKFSF